MYVAEVCLS
jgi:hypothetical protein